MAKVEGHSEGGFYRGYGKNHPTTSNDTFMLNHHNGSFRSTDSSDSDVDSLTEDLDQIGRLNLRSIPSISNYLTIDSLPNLPNLPNFPDIPRLKELSNEISRYISVYVKSSKQQDDADEGSTEENAPGDQQRLVNSIKTAISTRIQMNNFLNDLNVGLSLSTALKRLQPLTDVIHESIILPVEDTSDFDDDFNTTEVNGEPEPNTEPVGVSSIVNSFQPLINEIVIPEDEEVHHHHHHHHHHHDHSLKKKRKVNKSKTRDYRGIFSDENESTNNHTGTGSDLDNIEGLTYEEAKALTYLDSLDDFYKEDLLRKKIQNIQALSLPQKLKNKLVTRLMMGNYYKLINDKLGDTYLKGKEDLIIELVPEQKIQRKVEPEHKPEPMSESELDPALEPDMIMESTDDDEVVLTTADKQPSYFDPPHNTIMGCAHYQTNCKVECPTCLKWFPCKFCHDGEVTDHKLIRSDIKHILCMFCNVPQEPEDNYCVNCENELANYFCPICILYDNDTTKDIYHCDKCGICRLGLGLGKDYFHCDECNICLSIDLKEKHKCLSNTTHCNCPICNEYLFTSVSKVVFMKCGHLIHQACYDELSKHSYKCPICKKTVVNVETQFRILDQEIRQLPLPLPYSSWRCIISCNDCKGKSNVAYHVLGLKCKYCHSYNTNQHKLIKPEEEDEEHDMTPTEPEEDSSNFQRLASMKLMKTSLLDNFRIDDHNITEEQEYDGDGDDNGTELGADDKDELDEDNDNVHDIVNFRRLTSAILGNKPEQSASMSISSSYITSILQNFINSATSKSGDDMIMDAKKTKEEDAAGV